MFADLKKKAAGIDRKRLYTAAAALLVAGAAGYSMQRNSHRPAPVAPVVAASVSAPVAVPAPVATPAPVLASEVTRSSTPPTLALAEPNASNTPDTPDDVGTGPAWWDAGDALSAPEATAPPEPDIMLAAIDTAPATPAITAPPAAENLDAACIIAITATPQAGALVALSLDAPCNSGEEVDFNQNGLLFSEQLGTDGSLFMLVPAMTQDAVFVASFADGQQARAEAQLPDFDDFERVALVWKGATGFQLHALENGATYGESGHVWAERPASVDAAVAGKGGFVSVLGSTAEGYAADVYTFPAGLMADGASPDISIEAQVMENTCNGKIIGNVMRTNPGKLPSIEDLSMAVPGCDSVGEYLVLKNLPQNLKLARN